MDTSLADAVHTCVKRRNTVEEGNKFREVPQHFCCENWATFPEAVSVTTSWDVWTTGNWVRLSAFMDWRRKTEPSFKVRTLDCRKDYSRHPATRSDTKKMRQLWNLTVALTAV
uniref:Uncharacterized protein n=1 Tax=Steinernema glaseri TaxID=37863 RepID=A0A1I7XY96_9BILA